MKQYFHGYYKPTDKEFDAIWNDANIVVDANVLLNLYTYSEQTSQEILLLLEEFIERLWMTHQAALEYHKNRFGIILKESKRYAEIAKNLEIVGKDLRSRNKHPYITPALVDKFEAIEILIKKELNEGELKHRDLITSDSICDKIRELFDGKIGPPMPEEVLEGIYKEGAKRYNIKIPPGYSDVKKPEPDRYGDLILWYQLIEYAKTSSRPMILITDDLKEDWWSFAGDRRIGPRPELRHEFRFKTKFDIYIYSSEMFVEMAKNRGKKLSEFASDEIESASMERQVDALEKLRMKQFSHDPLEEFHMQHIREQDVLERMSNDPLEKYQRQLRREQDMMERMSNDPLEKYQRQLRREQDMMERMSNDPLEKYQRQLRREQEMIRRAMVKP